MQRHSPLDLRGSLESEALEPYQPPRTLTRQAKIDQSGKPPDDRASSRPSESATGTKSRKSWLAKLSSASKAQQDLRHKLSKRIARLSSLDSTRSSSSMEEQLDQNSRTHPTAAPPPPLISITHNDDSHQPNARATGDGGQRFVAHSRTGAPSASQRRADYYRDYYGRTSKHKNDQGSIKFGAGLARNDHEYDDDEDEDDAFEDAPLPMPYSSSSMSRTVVRQQTERGISYPTGANSYAELLDDRQGMNDGEQQFTKAEKHANRSSIDEGGLVADFRVALKKVSGQTGGSSNRLAASGSLGQKRDKRRSKSPSSMYGTKSRRQSRRGFLGLASRLKLTKKHESIARLQLSILNSGFVSLKTLDRDLQSFLPCERLTIREFQERVKLMRKFEVLSTIEYRFASKYETYVCKHAQRETNQPKNSYKKCIPYDYNRVVLKTLPNVPDSDYINASHVDSCLKPNAYIAAQGPNEFTIDDFWRMIWEQKTFVIVMLTKVFDFIRVMCNQYWPVELNKPERYGNIEVTLLYEEPLADFVIRTIRIVKLRGDGAPATATPGVTEPNQTTASTDPSANGGAATNQSDNENDFLNEEPYDLEDDDDDDDEDYDEEVIGITSGDLEPSQGNEATIAGQRHSLTVRAPRFVATGRRERSLSPAKERLADEMRRSSSHVELGPAARCADKQQVGRAASASPSVDPNVPLSRRRPTPTNDFLHPLFSRGGGNSAGSSELPPGSPMTPRTPSSAGLDRSSATRRAVKKKRRERIKNQRPRRTQFMVPTESQLLDDDDDDNNSTAQNQATAAATSHQNERIIYQFHYNSWQSHTCPFISSLLHFRRRVRICMDEMSKSGKTGCTVVHCNDGCGRTGTFLCIDANLELAEEDNVIDIYNYTRKMRQSRKFLIENLEQYKFVYDTIEEALYCGKTWFPVSELHKRLKHKSQRNPITKKNEYLVEYEKICQMTTRFSIGDCAGGHRVENREKNRDVSTVPPDNFRPYLTSFQTNDSTDYINAVFIDGYTRSKEYIVTEWPLHRTISDFWSLVYDHDCNSVILLANPGESSTYPSFLPSEKELIRKFGPVFQAEMVSYTHYQNIKSWIYTIDKKKLSLTEIMAGVKRETKTAQVFQITCWPQGHRVPTSTNALVELMNMVERWRQRTTYGPVCVVSLDGKSRAGVYCAANVAIEQVVQHSEVDVFNAVKTVRRNRPQLIENMTEYKYCYDLILHYVIHYVNNQSNAGA